MSKANLSQASSDDEDRPGGLGIKATEIEGWVDVL